MSGPPGLLPPTRPERTNETSLHKHGDANLARQICVRSSFDGGGKGRRTYQLVFAYRIQYRIDHEHMQPTGQGVSKRLLSR